MAMMSAASASLKAHWRTHTSGLIERIPWAPTVERDLRERRCAQRFPAFC
jgi:hypothetical protein